MDQITKLKLAIAGSRYGPGDARLGAHARTRGTAAFSEILDHLGDTEHERVTTEAEGLIEHGVSVMLLGSSEYPGSLSSLRNAPPSLFYLGAPELMTAPGIGMCGSRNASDEGIRAAAACSEVAAQLGLTVISGYARGVDMTTHVKALATGGATVIVLPEGISRFRVKRGTFAEVWDSKRTLIVSQFAPTRPWSTGGAMMRNSVIIGLSLALVVVEASENGGTFAAGTEALKLNRRVIALEFEPVPRGNATLLARGAIPIRNLAELSACLADVGNEPGGNQLSFI